MRTAPALSAALLLAALPSLPSRADEPAERARAAFQRGQTEYNLGNYAEAARLFEETYRLKPVPALLFNIAQSYRFVGDLEKAARAYRSFVRNAPANDRNLELGKELLAQVETALASRKHAETSAPHGLAQGGAPADKAPHATAPPVADAARTPLAADRARPAGTTLATATSAATQPPPLATTSQVTAAAAEPRGRVFTWVAAGGAALALGGGALYASKSSSTLSGLRTGYHDRATIDAQSAAAKSDAGKANLLLVSGVALAALSGAFFVMHF